MMRIHEVELISAKRSGQSLPIGQNFFGEVELQDKSLDEKFCSLSLSSPDGSNTTLPRGAGSPKSEHPYLAIISAIP
jgi:hypothetical protein